MINVKKLKNNNKFQIEYNTDNGVKYKTIECKPLKVIKSDDGEFKDLYNNSYTISKNGNGKLAYHCLNIKPKDKKPFFNYYLNVILQLEDSFFSKLKHPKLLFYDIETNGLKDDKVKITSIAWVTPENKEYCIVNGVDGSEKEIIEEFVDYCKNNKIMGLVGHNSFEFDNKVMIVRCKYYNLNYGVFYNNCNLDTIVLAKVFQHTNDYKTSLNDLAELLDIKDSKINTGIYDPVSLYYEAMGDYKKNNDDKKLKLFIKYNIQDVKLTKKCFNEMNSLNQLNEVFIQTKCQFNKVQYSVNFLNNFTCRHLYKNNIIVPETVNIPVEFKNEGGYNHYNETDKLQVYDNVLVVDINSYYPQLLMIINADPTNEYNNINRKTGEIKLFELESEIGIISEIAKILYNSRMQSKNEMKETEDPELKKQLNYKQKAKKITVNSLYGVLDEKDGQYILKNELIASTITKIGRETLKHIIKKFNVVYAKTDSIFILLNKNDDPDMILNMVNIEVSKFLLKNYNLNNIKDGEPLVRFEIDSLLDKLIIKDKNNYVKKHKNGEYELKGGSFKSSTFSEFEKDIVNKIIKLVDKNEDYDNIVKILIKDTKKLLSNNNIHYFERIKKLSKKNKDTPIIEGGTKYMEDHNLPYNWGFKYCYCVVESGKYEHIMYPKGHTPQFNIKHTYVFKLLFNLLNNIKIIDDVKKKSLIKEYKNIHNDQSDLDDSKIYNNDKISIEKNENEINKRFDNDNEISIEKIKINKKFDKINNDNIKELNKLIPDTAEYYEDNKLCFIPYRKNTKRGYISLELKNPESLNKFELDKNIKKEDNIALVTGYDNLRCLDIDGNNTLTEDENQELKNELLKILKTIGYPFIIQETQSGGYHLFYHSKNIENFNLNHIKYPSNYKFEKLRNKSLGTNTIEIFEKNHSMVFTPSKIDDGKDKGVYKLLSDNYKWKQIFDNDIGSIKDVINEAFKKAGYIVGKIENKPDYNIEYQNEYNIKNLNNEEIEKISEYFSDILIEANKSDCKHYVSYAMGGAFSRRIEKGNVKEICQLVSNKIGHIMDDTEAFKKAVLDNYNSEHTEKVGFNKIINEYLPNNKKVKNEINKLGNICTKIIDYNKDDRNENNIYNTSKSSYIEYKGKISYKISPQFLKHMSLELRELEKEIRNLDFNNNNYNLSLSQLITGGFYHYGLSNDNIKKILKLSKISEFIEYSNSKNIIKIGSFNKVYGFNTLFEILNKKNKNNKNINKTIRNIKSLLGKATVLNPYFYKTDSFSQKKIQLFNDNDKPILNCGFLEITKYKFVGNPTWYKPIAKYDIKLKFKNGNIEKLKGYTLSGLQEYLSNSNLFMDLNDNTIKNKIRAFFNEIENKGDMKYIEKSYIKGFILELKNGKYLLHHNLNLKIKGDYKIEDGVKELNSIYEDVYNKNEKFIKVFIWFLIHSLREIFRKFNVLNNIVSELILYGVGGTGKTSTLLICNQIFTDNILTEVGGEADTISTVNRTLGISTLPLIIDDPTTDLKEYEKIIKRTNFSTKGSAKAREQYGNEVNSPIVTRQLVFTSNEDMKIKEGLNRRIYKLGYTEDDKFTSDQKKQLEAHFINYKGDVKILKLNIICFEFIKFLKKFFFNIKPEISIEIVKSKGKYIIDDFFNHINENSNIKLHEDFTKENIYEFENNEIDYRYTLYERLKYHFNNGVDDLNFIEYNENDLNVMLNRSNFITKIVDDKKKKKENQKDMIVIFWDKFKEFIESPAGLNIPITKKWVYDILKLPNTNKYRFKSDRLGKGDDRPVIMKLSIEDFYTYFLDSYMY